MYFIRSSKKLKAAAFFLLIVQNGVFAFVPRKCMFGVKYGETEGWGDDPKGVPIEIPCDGATRSCLRLEVDEIGDPNGERIKNFVAMSCVEMCTEMYENVPEEQLNNEVINIVNVIVQGFKPDMIGAKVGCCSTEKCNSEPIPKPSAGSQLAAPLSFLTVFVAAFYN